MQQQNQQGLQSIGQDHSQSNKRVRLSGPSGGVHPQQNSQMNQEFHQHQQNQMLFNNNQQQQQQAQQQAQQQQQVQQQQSFQQRF